MAVENCEIPRSRAEIRSYPEASHTLRARHSRNIAMTESTVAAPKPAVLDRYFGLAENGTDLRTEIIAGFR